MADAETGIRQDRREIPTATGSRATSTLPTHKGEGWTEVTKRKKKKKKAAKSAGETTESEGESTHPANQVAKTRTPRRHKTVALAVKPKEGPFMRI